MAVEQLHVSGYRSIRDLHLELERLTVIVGPNGCGKTNLYRSMLLVAAAANGILSRTLADEGNIAFMSAASCPLSISDIR